jgi:hypothetical protein
MMMICYPAGPRAAEGSILAPDLKPMLEHATIVSEMMRACGHARSDLAAQLRGAGAAWWIRNARVQKALAELTEDAAGASSKDGGLALSPSAVSPAKSRRDYGCLQGSAPIVAAAGRGTGATRQYESQLR